jgi:hypothetical protein
MNLSLDVFNTDIDVSEIEEPEKNDFGETYPEETGVDPQEVYEDKIDEEHRDIIKKYFDSIKDSD